MVSDALCDFIGIGHQLYRHRVISEREMREKLKKEKEEVPE